MRKIYLAVLALLFCISVYAADDLVIKVGMKFDDAQKILKQTDAKEANMDMRYPPTDSSQALKTYDLPGNRILAVTSTNQGSGFIITNIEVVTNSDLPKYFQVSSTVQEIDLYNNSTGKQ